MLQDIRATIEEVKETVRGSLPMRAVGGDYVINTLIQVLKDIDAKQAEIDGGTVENPTQEETTEPGGGTAESGGGTTGGLTEESNTGQQTTTDPVDGTETI